MVQNKLKKAVLKCFIILLGGSIFCSTAKVTASELSKNETKTYAFAVPDGGWSFCTVHMIYTEQYSHSSLNLRNTFSLRSKWFTGTYTYATSCPRLGTGAAVIKTGTNSVYQTFTSWTQRASIYPGGVNTMGYFENSGSFVLSDSTNYTGQINYSVECTDATPGIQYGNTVMSLSTN